MVDPLLEAFPALGLYRITSARSEDYNCIAWAAGDTSKWWWPEERPGIYWPPGLPREETVPAFAALFTLLGYEPCVNPDDEDGSERIALFADAADCPTHAARQLPTRRWTSKLGRAEDIEHTLHDLEGKEYGKVVLVMRRLAVRSASA